jgi:hypothetical protein
MVEMRGSRDEGCLSQGLVGRSVRRESGLMRMQPVVQRIDPVGMAQPQWKRRHETCANSDQAIRRRCTIVGEGSHGYGTKRCRSAPTPRTDLLTFAIRFETALPDRQPARVASLHRLLMFDSLQVSDAEAASAPTPCARRCDVASSRAADVASGLLPTREDPTSSTEDARRSSGEHETQDKANTGADLSRDASGWDWAHG